MQLDWTCRFSNVKAILQLKKSLNLGEISDHFKIIANKLLELEGTFTDGFENNIKHLLNNKNWNLINCKQGKPSISLRKCCNQHAFELFCFPMICNEARAVVKSCDKNSPFKDFNLSNLGPLLSIPKLSNFVSITVRCGDEADIELIKYTHILIEQLAHLLGTLLHVAENDGQTIKEIFFAAEKQLKDLKKT